MVCIYCHSPTGVRNSRWQAKSNTVWRRRACENCGVPFTTIERAELSGSFMVRKGAGRLGPFDRDRLFISVYESCRHRKSAIDDATALTSIILDQILPLHAESIIERRTIAEVTHRALQRFDKAAATIYAAYHPADKPTS